MENNYPLQFLGNIKGIVGVHPMPDNTVAVILAAQGINYDNPDNPKLSDCYILDFAVLDADRATIEEWVKQVKKEQRIEDRLRDEKYISFERSILAERYDMKQWSDHYGDDVMRGFQNPLTALFVKTQQTITGQVKTSQGRAVVALNTTYADELENNMNAVSFENDMSGNETIKDMTDLTHHIYCAMLAYFALNEGMLAKIGQPLL